MEEYDTFDYDNGDNIFILKEDNLLSDEEFFKNVLKPQWEIYNKNTKDFEVLNYGDFKFSYRDDFLFNNREFYLLRTPIDRLRYAFASLHNDQEIEEILRKHFPTIQEFYIPSMRGTMKNYLRYWMKKYNFTLEDFLFNDKYIIISDNLRYNIVDKLIDMGVIAEDKIEQCSLWYDEEKEK